MLDAIVDISEFNEFEHVERSAPSSPSASSNNFDEHEEGQIVTPKILKPYRSAKDIPGISQVNSTRAVLLKTEYLAVQYFQFGSDIQLPKLKKCSEFVGQKSYPPNSVLLWGPDNDWTDQRQGAMANYVEFLHKKFGRERAFEERILSLQGKTIICPCTNRIEAHLCYGVLLKSIYNSVALRALRHENGPVETETSCNSKYDNRRNNWGRQQRGRDGYTVTDTVDTET